MFADRQIYLLPEGFRSFADMHLGDEFLSIVLYRIFSTAQDMANRFVIVDAKTNDKVIKFYERNGIA